MMSTDTVAVDREALVAVIYEHLYDNSPGDIADAILASGILRDAAVVRHEHGERIAKACEAANPEVRDIWDDEGKGWSDACRYLAGRARDLSPPP